MKTVLGTLLGAAILAGALVGAGSAAAQSIVSTGQSFVSVRMLPGFAEADGARVIGLRLSLQPGWKTYWRSPGEAGIPPHLDWSASRNLATVEVLWPRPELFVSFGMQTIGYSEQIVIPVRMTPEDPAEPLGLSLAADIGVCREICVIERVELAEDIVPDQRAVGAKQINRAIASVPRPAAETGMTGMVCRITGAGAERDLTAQLSFSRPLDGAAVIVEGSETVWITKTESHVADGVLHVTAKVEVPEEVTWLDRSSVRMTVLGADFAADIQGCQTSG